MKLTHFMIHCASTPEGKDFKAEAILHWHMLPAAQPNGTFKYKGIIYPNAEALPNDFIGGLSVKKYRGDRGWRAPGYPDVIVLNGSIKNIWKYNDDDEVDAFEITNGILSTNSLYRCTRHIVYIGGMDSSNKVAKDTRTPAQTESLKNCVLGMIQKHPQIRGIGHNQVDPRACPSFDVPKWLRAIGVQEKNIDNRPLLFQLPG
jgi:N-acetylmuramoyl-L-alanine amidase